MNKNTAKCLCLIIIIAIALLGMTACEMMEIVPSDPSWINASAQSSSSIRVMWSQVSDATSYEVEYHITGGIWATGTDTSSYTWLHTGLTADTTYTYRVRAVNSAGHSNWSRTASATTRAASSN